MIKEDNIVCQILRRQSAQHSKQMAALETVWEGTGSSSVQLQGEAELIGA